MTKLYTVKVSFDFVVVADNTHDAYQVGLRFAKDALSDMPIDDVDMDIVPGDDAYGWDDMCIPYGGDGNTRTSEYKKKVEK